MLSSTGAACSNRQRGLGRETTSSSTTSLRSSRRSHQTLRRREKAGHGFHLPGAGVGWSCRLPPPPSCAVESSSGCCGSGLEAGRGEGREIGLCRCPCEAVEDENLSPAAPLQLSADRAAEKSRKWGRDLSSLPSSCTFVCTRSSRALGQCEIALSKLDIVRESVGDSAGAAQLIAL
ncbi:hypothetical protein OPV22_024401 [Ensete ventricosum]|uniref:Uncharacterized protein n=1 Tax=Ensete ventricosum TaxID=4639 RepID=A0AAV8QAN6_ENSVE|nr:hypothetical protein OPV22_024401 [Ensete ventricosum]